MSKAVARTVKRRKPYLDWRKRRQAWLADWDRAVRYENMTISSLQPSLYSERAVSETETFRQRLSRYIFG